MDLYFVRHGQSVGNLSGVHQGLHEALSDEGKEQAKFLARRLKKVNVDRIFTSPLRRARQTAQIISYALNSEIELRDELREAAWPSEMVGLHNSDPLSEQIRSDIRNNIPDPDYKYSDEESFNELRERVKSFLNHLIKEHKHENVVCIAHGLIIKIFIGEILFEEEFNPILYYKFRDNSWINNTGITKVEYSDQRGWVLTTWNDITHL